ncbi:MAG: terminase small subunit protein [Pseudomonadota bacterium]
MGRKSSYSQKIADEICARLIEGQSLRRICTDDKMPSIGAVMKWLRVNPAFVQQYARAREEQADTLFDEILQIADTPQEGVQIIIDSKGTREVKGDMIHHRRLQIDARKWMAGKLRPKKYGDIKAEEAGAGETIVRVLNSPDLD